ncbi:hypothetical protein [uncultured Piscinibacter sp.]|uniref:hypothetical protein n=1 Tax=uncultured Piscinibacter sp. TaxID=1131835 RepID=UPI00345BF2FE
MEVRHGVHVQHDIRQVDGFSVQQRRDRGNRPPHGRGRHGLGRAGVEALQRGQRARRIGPGQQQAGDAGRAPGDAAGAERRVEQGMTERVHAWAGPCSEALCTCPLPS